MCKQDCSTMVAEKISRNNSLINSLTSSIEPTKNEKHAKMWVAQIKLTIVDALEYHDNIPLE